MKIIRNPDTICAAGTGGLPARFEDVYPAIPNGRRLIEMEADPGGSECYPASYDQWTADPLAKEILGYPIGREHRA